MKVYSLRRSERELGQALAPGRAGGQALLPVVITLATLLGLIGVTLAGAEIIQTNLSTQRVFAEQARNAAQSGANDALIRIERDTTWGTDSDILAEEGSPGTYSLAVGNNTATTSVDRMVTATFDGDGFVQSDPTSGWDGLYAVTLDSSGVYFAGYQSTGGGCSTGLECWRIEKRDLTTGALVTAFDGDGIVTSDPTNAGDTILAIAVNSSAVYVAGYQATGGGCVTGGICWRIEKRDLTTGALVTAFDTDGIVTSDPTNAGDAIRAIALNSSGLYIAGYQSTGASCVTGGTCWRIEKRDLTTGALVTAFDGDGIVTSDPTNAGDEVRAIALDSSGVYFAGYQATGGGCSTGSECWRIEKRDLTTGALVTAFDGDGIVTSDLVSGDEYILASALDSSGLYIAGYQATGGGCSTGSYCWRIEKRDLTTGALITAFDTDGIVTSDPTSGLDVLNAVSLDSSGVYFAGYQATGGGCSTGSECWRIEKRDLTTGALVAGFDGDGIVTSDPTSGGDVIYAIALDSGGVYFAGYQATGGGCSTGSECWRIEKRSLGTAAMNTKKRVIISTSTVRNVKRTLKVTLLVSSSGGIQVTKREEL